MGSRTSASDDLLELDHVVDVFKALGHPLRLEIMRRMVAVPELACTELEHALPITKQTISYHIKMLHRARLITVRRDGRYFFYSPRFDEIEAVVPGLVPLLRDARRPCS